jgi:hypothetical protein
MAALAQQEVEQLVDGGKAAVVVIALEIGRVAEPAFDLGGSEPRFERLGVRGSAQIGGERLIIFREDSGPAGAQAAQDGGPAGGNDLLLEPLAIHVFKFGNRPHGARR